MQPAKHVKRVYEGSYLGEVEVTLIDDEQPWGLHLLLEDGKKLDAVRSALKSGDLQAASQLARIFRLIPVPTA